jgi:hypothetical protein
MMAVLQVVVGGGGQLPTEVIQIGHSGMPSGAIFALALTGLFAAVLILWPLVRALSRRIEGRGEPDQAMLEEMDQMRQRLAQLEDLPHRVAELEERAEFAERLLSQNRDVERLPGRAAN